MSHSSRSHSETRVLRLHTVGHGRTPRPWATASGLVDGGLAAAYVTPE